MIGEYQPYLYVNSYPSGKSFKFEYSLDLRVCDVKKHIYEVFRIRPTNQEILLGGKLLGDDYSFDELEICPSTVLHLVIRPFDEAFDFFHPDFDIEIRNFAVMRKNRFSCLNVSRSDTDFINSNKWCGPCLLYPVLSAGKYGPLSLILSYVDPVELLYTFFFISKAFHDATLLVLTNTENEEFRIDMNQNHFHVLFGRYSTISESLFINLMNILRKRLKSGQSSLSTIQFCDDVPQHSFDKANESNLLRSALSRKYYKAAKILIERDGLEMTPYLLSKHHTNIDFLRFVLNACPYLAIHKKTYLFLMNTERWDLVTAILQKTTLTPVNENYIFEALFAYLKDERQETQNVRVCSFEKFRNFEECCTFCVNKNQYELKEVFHRHLDHELKKHIFTLAVKYECEYLIDSILLSSPQQKRADNIQYKNVWNSCILTSSQENTEYSNRIAYSALAKSQDYNLSNQECFPSKIKEEEEKLFLEEILLICISLEKEKKLLEIVEKLNSRMSSLEKTKEKNIGDDRML